MSADTNGPADAITTAMLQPSPTGQVSETHPRHRPSTFNLEIAEKICEETARGVHLRDIERMDGFPTIMTIARWRTKYPEFGELFDLSRQIYVECLEQDILAIVFHRPRDRDGFVDYNGPPRAQQLDADTRAHMELMVQEAKIMIVRKQKKSFVEPQLTIAPPTAVPQLLPPGSHAGDNAKLIGSVGVNMQDEIDAWREAQQGVVSGAGAE